MHEKGYLTVKYGSIYPQEDTIFMIDNMAMVIDGDAGSVLKYGDINNSDIKKYYEKLKQKYENLNEANDIFLLTFDRYNGILDIDEICTLCNYFLNHIGERLIETLKMDIQNMKNLIRELQRIGF